MKKNISLIAMAVLAITISSCEKQMQEENYAAGLVGKNGTAAVGAVYTLSNNSTNNQVLVYSRSVGGMLSYKTAVNTGGTGTGTGLGNQGALALAGDWLFAVNPGSNSVSSLKQTAAGLELVSTIASGGTQPISLTVWQNLLYVLNAGGTGNITGFTIGADGSLTALANSTRPLSSSNAGAAQVSFVNGGAALAVTEKATNTIITYSIMANGTPGTFHSIMSANQTPFGFAVGEGGMIYVSEAAGGAPGASTVSSYSVSMTGEIMLVDGPVSAGQTAACWVAINNNNKYVYATNTASNNISSFSAKGSLTVLEAIAGPGNLPIDATFNNNSKYLYVLNSGNETIHAFAVNKDGGLMLLQTTTGLPDGATGLVSK